MFPSGQPPSCAGLGRWSDRERPHRLRPPHRDPRRRLQRGVDAGARCSIASRPDFRAAHRRGARLRRREPGRTYLVGLGYQQICRPAARGDPPAERNLGYGGNQKAGYRWAIEHGLDIVVLLHGDGQYAPELLPEIVAPLERGEADAVFGSRMLRPGRARGGAGCRSTSTSATASSRRSRTRSSACRPVRVALRLPRLLASPRCGTIPFERNNDGFDFDTQIIVQLHRGGQAHRRDARSRPTTATRSAT